MMQNNKNLNINISSSTIFKIFFVLVSLYFLFLVKDVLILLFVSLILASAFNPWVDWMQKFRIPRALGVLFIYLIMFSVLFFVLYLIIPPIGNQIRDFSENFPAYLDKTLSSYVGLKEFANEHGILEQFEQALLNISSYFQTMVGNLFTTVTGIFSVIFSFFLVLVITFYMVVEENAIKKIIWSFAPEKHQPYIMQLVLRMQKKIGLWLRGQLILSFIIFLLTFIGLKILGVNYALTLALIAGLTEFIPYLGPVLAAIPAVFLSFTQSPMLAIFVIILYYIIQLVENNIVVPKLMQKVVGLNPIIIIVVLLIGFKIAGIVGAIISIPAATAINVFLRDVFNKRAAVENEPAVEK
jgi:predicted PurR-regulated permease PerM